MAPHNAAAAPVLHRAGPPRQCDNCGHAEQRHNADGAPLDTTVHGYRCMQLQSPNFDEVVDPTDTCNHWEHRR